ncbi:MULTISPECIES: HAD family hydrolase [Vibrio]|uniref:HAD family hydrolase n=9 Tax=Vibrio TaxID=662 RepID=A0A243VVH2_VIBPH|nr:MULTISPECIES: HAD family hydrolase [Vibrio]EJG0763170.1 HAD-IA family hydrolase [Vibrio parahaemolyticus O5:K30]EJG0872202.1 HAD-IA family hydrolase [Vibrio parahaemolyticus O3]EJG0900861.1 HAD-IA family hydrolase [Vibrio parahaemolyticus O3:K56]EJG0950812.1 HAD-IA family hydrolase [Vibrio parahaemolyticus O1:K58]EJG1075529.1 HAD-IA family hydrolase [Vibrio parahaemolyticus O1:K56]KIT29809.1 HAD family hydrolase [Vibrio parahaemolyticus VP766]KIT52401.1 HAD family hydrolase [Vibrio paraha
MLKAIFFDMDETLCGTSQADKAAGQKFAAWIQQTYPQVSDPQAFLQRYLQGVYKKLNAEFPQLVALLPDENAFRCGLIQTILAENGIHIDAEQAQQAQHYFDSARMGAFTFFPGVKEMLTDLRKHYKLVVITNGPIFSQHPKLKATQMDEWVDHIIVGGEEPEEKPAASIFQKALNLVDIKPEEALHIGDSLAADIAGANNMGILSVWVNATGASNPTEITPNFEIRETVELKEILKTLAQ